MMPELDLPVKLKRFSIGSETCNVGVDIHKNFIKLDRVAKLGNRRLIGRIVRGRNGDAEGQESFVEGEELVGAFDTRSVSIKADFYGTSITFALTDLDANDLKLFANASGRLIVDEVTAIPEKPKKAKQQKEDPAQRDFTAEGPWRDVLLDELFKGATLAAMHETELQTVGDYADWIASGKTNTDLPGVGEKKGATIDEVFDQFWRDNPQEEDADEDFDE